MKQITRYVVVLLVLLSIVLLARNTNAGAGLPENPSSGAELAPAAAKTKPGTVKPPKDVVVVTRPGTYSIGGFCNYTVDFTEPYSTSRISVHIARETPLPRPLPAGVHAVRQGCRVTYYQAGQRLDAFTDAMGTSEICFAAVPGQDTQIYFYNVYAEEPIWASILETTEEDGVVCAEADQSGIYVAAFEAP